VSSDQYTVAVGRRGERERGRGVCAYMHGWRTTSRACAVDDWPFWTSRGCISLDREEERRSWRGRTVQLYSMGLRLGSGMDTAFLEYLG
jgi:hypothetical protein